METIITKPRPAVPTYALYGEEGEDSTGFLLHCETILSRSQKYGFEIGRHRHLSFFQILTIEAGTGDVLLDGGIHPLAAGSVVTLPPMVSHGFRFSHDIEGLVITIDAESLAFKAAARDRIGDWLAEPHLLALDSGHEDTNQLARALAGIGREFASRRVGRNDLLVAMITSTLVLAARIGLERAGDGEPGRDNPDRRIARLRQLIDRHFQEHRPATFYAAEIGLSPTHLNRLVRKKTGMSTHELIANRLIDQARRDLIFTQVPVQDISYALGFADPAYFSRFFTGHVGATPKQYRQRERLKLQF